jgi:hypothetical protein
VRAGRTSAGYTGVAADNLFAKIGRNTYVDNETPGGSSTALLAGNNDVSVVTSDASLIRTADVAATSLRHYRSIPFKWRISSNAAAITVAEMRQMGSMIVSAKN